MNKLPRLLPDSLLPTYAFVGGGPFPHPRSDPEGHSHGQPEIETQPLDPDDWSGSECFLRGFDLFNHGYYWEAHEQWEALWLACGRRGAVADLLKALIKIAAAGVKARQGRSRGVRSHAHRAHGHLADVRSAAEGDHLAGLDLIELMMFAQVVHDSAEDWSEPRLEADVEVVFPRPLLPR